MIFKDMKIAPRIVLPEAEICRHQIRERSLFASAAHVLCDEPLPAVDSIE
jgi:hypothetical protein